MRPSECPVKPGAIRELIAIIDDGTVSNNQAKDVFAKMWMSRPSPQRRPPSCWALKRRIPLFWTASCGKSFPPIRTRLRKYRGAMKTPELAYRPGHEGRQRQSQPENRDGSAEKARFPWSNHKQRAASLPGVLSLPAGHHGLNSFPVSGQGVPYLLHFPGQRLLHHGKGKVRRLAHTDIGRQGKGVPCPHARPAERRPDNSGTCSPSGPP